MSKNINKGNMITRINQSIKLDYLDEQIDKIVNELDNNSNKNKQSKTTEKVIYKQDSFKKRRKWFIPFICLVSFTFDVCAITTTYYLLIQSNIIGKKKITLKYELKKMRMTLLVQGKWLLFLFIYK